MKQSTASSLFRKCYPWLVFTLSSSFLFYKYLLQVSPGVMVHELMRYFELSGEAMGNLAAFYFYAYLAMQLPVGLLLDHLNPRRLVAAAVAVCAVGAWLFSISTHLGVAGFGRVLIGLGGAFSAVGTMKLITIWFPPKRFALVSGLMMTVGMLGAVGGQAPLAHSVAMIGWRDTLFYTAILGLVLSIAILCFISDKPDKSDTSSGILSGLQDGFLSSLIGIVKSRQCWIISLYSGLAFAPISAFAGLWGVPFLMETYHLPRSHVAALVSLVFIGFAIGSPLAGWLSDRIGRRKPLMVLGTSLGMLALTMIIYWTAFPIPILGLLLCLFGFFTSFFFISFAVMREIQPLKAGGTSIGFINMFNALCGALSEPLVGKLLDMQWNHQISAGVRVFSVHAYQFSLLSLPLCMLLALCFMIFLKETYCESIE